MELVDMLDLGSSVLAAWEFESLPGHHFFFENLHKLLKLLTFSQTNEETVLEVGKMPDYLIGDLCIIRLYNFE